jgi:hypothetical protein
LKSLHAAFLLDCLPLDAAVENPRGVQLKAKAVRRISLKNCNKIKKLKRYRAILSIAGRMPVWALGFGVMPASGRVQRRMRGGRRGLVAMQVAVYRWGMVCSGYASSGTQRLRRGRAVEVVIRQCGDPRRPLVAAGAGAGSIGYPGVLPMATDTGLVVRRAR